MARLFFLVDGFNLYHALDAVPRYRKYKWISLTKLAGCYALKKDSIVGVEYFTTLALWDPNKAARHRVFIKAQESEGVTVVYGQFKRKQRRCRLCGGMSATFEEKQTDVNLALRLFQLAVLDRFDAAVIISGDTDLIPAVKAVQATFPGKRVGVVIPIGRASEDLKKHTDFHHRMKEIHLASSRLPYAVNLRDGTVLTCPSTWA